MISASEDIETFLRQHFAKRGGETRSLSPQLVEAMAYSLFSGGKRFRPNLCLQAAMAFGGQAQEAIPYAAAIELIHTYSLIHDDLPSMDNDDIRRGKPTNHKIFGEALALLAGDALLTEAFYIIAQSYSSRAQLSGPLVLCLSSAAGMSGMVGGQAMDMSLGAPLHSIEGALLTHRGKTAALIAAALEGAAVITQLNTSQIEVARCLGESLGIAFQVRDDLLDREMGSANSVLSYWSEGETNAYLDDLLKDAQEMVQTLPPGSEELLTFFSYNRERQI